LLNYLKMMVAVILDGGSMDEIRNNKKMIDVYLEKLCCCK